MKKIHTIALFFWCTANLFAQNGAWTLGKGGAWTSGLAGGFFTLEQRALLANDFYNKEGKKAPIPETALLTTSLSAQLGVLSKLDVIAYLPVFVYNYQAKLSTASLKGSKSSVGDMEVGLKYGIIQNTPLALSLGLRLGIPTGDSAKETEDALARFQTGDGEFNQWIHTDVGVSFAPVSIAVGASFNNRTRSFSDELSWYASARFSLKIIALKVYASGLYALDNGSRAEDPELLYTTFLNNTSSLTYGGLLSLGFLPKMGFFLGADILAEGKNTLAGPSIYVGLYLDL